MKFNFLIQNLIMWKRKGMLIYDKKVTKTSINALQINLRWHCLTFFYYNSSLQPFFQFLFDIWNKGIKDFTLIHPVLYTKNLRLIFIAHMWGNWYQLWTNFDNWDRKYSRFYKSCKIIDSPFQNSLFLFWRDVMLWTEWKKS